MPKLFLKYGLDDKPPILELLLYGLQWLAIAIPTIIIIGKVVASLHFSDIQAQVMYIQRIFFVVGISLIVQILWGHRLPLIIGPATVLLVGITASQSGSTSSFYTSIFIGGLTLSLLSLSGMFAHVRKLFTPRVIATILMLIAFTLTPMILNLITSPDNLGSGFFNLTFALVMVLAMFVANRNLKGIWKATLIIWAIILGTTAYALLQPIKFVPYLSQINSLGLFELPALGFSFEPGVLISFLVCFLALSINDLGSMQGVGELLKADKMDKRITMGIVLTGVSNMFSGLLSVIGPVNFSLSPGVIASTGVASRYTLLPAGASLILLAFLPGIIAIIGSIPPVVIGSTLLYLMTSQIAAGLLVSTNSIKEFRLEQGLVMGLPMMLSITISFLAPAVIATFPIVLRPILGNGFVVGVISVLIMEHVIYKKL